MIKINNSTNQNIDVSTPKSQQEISVTNRPNQEVDIYGADTKQELNIFNSTPNQPLDILTPWVTRPELSELKIDIDSRVPKALSILPQAEEIEDNRDVSRIYVDANGTPSFATLEQIKRLNTKTILVNELSDKKINRLSDEDIILLMKE